MQKLLEDDDDDDDLDIPMETDKPVEAPVQLVPVPAPAPIKLGKIPKIKDLKLATITKPLSSKSRNKMIIMAVHRILKVWALLWIWKQKFILNVIG